MAEPNTLEWMTEQRDRLKAECDLANTRYDKLVADDKIAQQELRQQIASIETARAQEYNALTAKTADEARKMQTEIDSLKALALARKTALADVMKLVGAVIEKVLPLLSE